jgi:hypothetical protein
MADPVCHATQGALMMVAPFISRLRKRAVLWTLVLVGAVLGDLPDLMGVYGFFVKHDSGVLYESAHIGPISHVLVFIPMSGLHLYLDSVMHELENGWSGYLEWLWLEVLMWVLNIVLIYAFVRIWKRNISTL